MTPGAIRTHVHTFYNGRMVRCQQVGTDGTDGWCKLLMVPAFGHVCPTVVYHSLVTPPHWSFHISRNPELLIHI